MEGGRRIEACCPAHAFNDQVTYYYDEREWNWIPAPRLGPSERWALETSLSYPWEPAPDQAPASGAPDYAALEAENAALKIENERLRGLLATSHGSVAPPGAGTGQAEVADQYTAPTQEPVGVAQMKRRRNRNRNKKKHNGQDQAAAVLENMHQEQPKSFALVAATAASGLPSGIRNNGPVDQANQGASRGGLSSGRGGVIGPMGMQLAANSCGDAQGVGTQTSRVVHADQDLASRFVRRADIYHIDDADLPRYLPSTKRLVALKVGSEVETMITLRGEEQRKKRYMRGVLPTNYDKDKDQDEAHAAIMSKDTLECQETMAMHLWHSSGLSLDQVLADYEPEKHNKQAHSWMEDRALAVVCARCRAFKLSCNHHIPCQYCKEANAKCLVEYCRWEGNCMRPQCEKVHRDYMEAVAAEFQRLGFHGEKSALEFFKLHWYWMEPFFYPRADGQDKLHWQTATSLPPTGSGKPYNENNPNGFDVSRYPDGPPWLLEFCKDDRWNDHIMSELQKALDKQEEEVNVKLEARQAELRARIQAAERSRSNVAIKGYLGDEAGDLDSDEEEDNTGVKED
ncbi:uncharacterized protein MYCFIDRAFT_77291 [Pseudocercospora fijiensis CIRAD86]|uniref:Zn(2)-C6 fungal-type domain-containing protein n=1 Tax=Pseudocercospora fijiensis (strain CIRAD86) TaxID=383855 RepID=M2ZAR3_PSEFD|nr:uncharacterized protein MYCFIDRAFT_77291 [Pseudocercospora fijiensis CIRAD86]EME86915.1 hypothetical protein MYCFIDRAFT_77291 [Pseudocercospora fijiensis CIRAD86]